jgi:hypothetical protein
MNEFSKAIFTRDVREWTQCRRGADWDGHGHRGHQGMPLMVVVVAVILSK